MPQSFGWSDQDPPLRSISGAQTRLRLFAVSAIVILLTVIATWPQAWYLGSRFALHNDPHFSTWRLAWIAHALRTDPRHLFDANIFWPERHTLAYSDAALLEGVLAAPLFWLHLPSTVIYNVFLLGGMAASGLGMYGLARYLTRSTGAGLVAAAIFTMAPYRIEHFMHLELQWAMWIPAALWAVHRAVDEGSWRVGALAGIFLWLQILSAVYYGVFLAIMLAVMVVLLTITEPQRAIKALPGLLLGAAIAAALTIPYARPYVESVSVVGTRQPAELASYSATPDNYLASPASNWVWGWTADRWGATERRLFPGVLASLLALAAFAGRLPRVAAVYAVLGALGVELSFGTNGYLYRAILAHIGILKGLRAPARFSIMVCCALALMAALGIDAVAQRLASTRRSRAALFSGVLLVLCLEYGSAPMNLTPIADQSLDVYKILRTGEPGVLLELPVAPLDQLPGWGAVYALWSINHWRPIVNGYSGYYPPSYLQTLGDLRTFPDDISIARLERLKVRYIVVHRAFYERETYDRLIVEMGHRPELRPGGRYADPIDQADLFELSEPTSDDRTH
jgi:hypothetical protein